MSSMNSSTTNRSLEDSVYGSLDGSVQSSYGSSCRRPTRLSNGNGHLSRDESSEQLPLHPTPRPRIHTNGDIRFTVRDPGVRDSGPRGRAILCRQGSVEEVEDAGEKEQSSLAHVSPSADVSRPTLGHDERHPSASSSPPSSLSLISESEEEGQAV